jgi:hypothetical protein
VTTTTEYLREAFDRIQVAAGLVNFKYHCPVCDEELQVFVSDTYYCSNCIELYSTERLGKPTRCEKCGKFDHLYNCNTANGLVHVCGKCLYKPSPELERWEKEGKLCLGAIFKSCHDCPAVSGGCPMED